MNRNYNEDCCGCHDGLYADTTSSESGVYGCVPDHANTISVTNNFVEKIEREAKELLDEAKTLQKNAVEIVRQNSNVTNEYIEEIKEALLDEIDLKQDAGDYPLRSEIPTCVSDLNNDLDFVEEEDFQTVINEIKLPEQTGFEGKFLRTNGNQPYWNETDALTTTQITDCIIEKPNRVNVECANGTATVKAGSVVIVPYGIEAPTLSIGDYLAGNLNNNNFKIVDIQYKNNQLFYWVEVQRDISDNQAGDYKIHERTLYVSLSGNTPAAWVNSYSGTDGYSGTANCAYYFTNQNIIHNYASGTINNTSIISFPIGQVTASGDDFYANISQVFDGIGYIGNTVFVDKGVKLFSSDGRYEDGTLKNIEYTTPELNLASNISTGTYLRTLLYCAKGTGSIVAGVTIYEQNTTPPASSSGYERWFNPGENLWYNHQANETIWQKDTNRLVRIGTFASSSGNITSMNLHSAFRAVNYDWVTEHLHSLYSRQGIIESYVNGNSWYRKYSDGWCEQGGVYVSTSSATLSTFLIPFKSVPTFISQFEGDTAELGCTGSCIYVTATQFRVRNALHGGSHANRYGNNKWFACGYIN